MKKFIMTSLLFLSVISSPAMAENYVIDTAKAHAFIQFRIKHLGYSWLYGRFNSFDGTFSYDEKNPAAASVMVNIDTASIDSNHAERDKHLRSKDFLDVDKFPKASFASTSFKEKGNGKVEIRGNFTLHGVTKEITIDAHHVGHGNDPWGGYRRGFEGTTRFALKDFNISRDLGPASQEVEIILSVEGIRK